jgi:hypothetical protein
VLAVPFNVSNNAGADEEQLYTVMNILIKSRNFPTIHLPVAVVVVVARNKIPIDYIV